jgi:hypothetical protein
MNTSSISRWVIKPGVSLVLGGVFYAGWLAAFLATIRAGNSAAKGALFFLAPLVTAAGFTLGVAVFERSTDSPSGRFHRVLVWPLVGCAAGAAASFWYGPMLVSFSMLVGGALSVVFRDIFLLRKPQNH